jgi:predicted transcriptional regulator
VESAFTDRELDVMAVLWRRGSGTVAEVRDALSTDFAYTTVLTVLRTLEDKGFVSHAIEGKAHRYYPLVKQEAAGKSALARLLDTVFDGSRELLLTQLVSDRDVDAKTLRHLRDVLNERLDQKKGGKG